MATSQKLKHQASLTMTSCAEDFRVRLFLAGKRRGFEDTRGTLFFEIMRIAKVKRPKLLYFENVKGLLSHDEGRTFQTILRSMDDLGYDAEWQVFNSKNHGVPQNRERVFIIGHLRGGCTKPIFPITNGNETILKTGDGDSISTGCISTRNQSGQAQWDGSTTLIAGCLTGGGHSGGHHSDMTIIQINNPTHSNNRVYNPDGISPAINCAEGGNRQPFIKCHTLQPRCGNPDIGGTGPLSRDDGNTYCLDSGNCMGIEVNQRIRRLTPIECERLQGFPDNWTEGISDTQRYKCLGNAVTVNVIEFISLHIKEMLLNKDA